MHRLRFRFHSLAGSRVGGTGLPSRAVAPQRGRAAEWWAYNLEFLDPAFRLLRNRKHLRVLDFGCGHSRIPDRLRSEGHRVIGIDLEPPLQAHPDRLTGALLQLNLPPGQFDLIYSYQTFEHLPQPRPISKSCFGYCETRECF